MPLVKIEIAKGKDSGYKKTFLQAVHEALVTALKIPENDRIQRLYEVDIDCFEHEGKTENFSLIELTLFPGRSKEMKQCAVSEITRLLGERLNIQPFDIFIIINEPPLENWGLRGVLASDVGLSYKKD